jgi:hypothetical protein
VKKITSFFDFFVKSVTLIGLGLQLLPDIDARIKIYTIYGIFSIAIITVLMSIITYFIKRSQCGRKQLIKRGIAMLSNTQDKIICIRQNNPHLLSFSNK